MKGTSASLSLPSPSPAPSLSRCCSPLPQNILLHFPMAQEASFLSLPIKPVKPSVYFLSLVSSMWRTLPDKALLFYKWFWHRVSQATPTPKDIAPGATLTFTSPLKTSPWQPLCDVCRYQSATGDKDRPSARMALQATRQRAGQDTTFCRSRGPGNLPTRQVAKKRATPALRAQPDLSLRTT